MQHRIYPGWWQLGVAMMIQAISAASIFTSYSIVAAPLKAEFQPSNMVLMFGITSVSLVSGLLSPPIGSAIDRFSLRRLMLAGLALIATGFFLLSFATAMVQVVAIYAVCMAGGVVLLGPIASSALMARWFTRRRGLAMGLASSGAAIGGLLLPPLLQTLIDSLAWRQALQVYGVLLLIVAGPVITWVVIDRPDARHRGTPDAGDDTAPARPSPATTTPALSTRQLLRQPAFWLITLILGTVFCGPMAVISNMIQFVSEKGVDATQGAFLLSVFSGANFGGKVLSAGVLDRIRMRLAIASMLGVLGLGITAFLLADSYALLMLASITSGIAGGAAVPIWSLTLSRVYGPDRIGQVMGIMTLVMMPFTLLSPPVFGWVFDYTGSYDGAFYGYLIMLAAAVVLLARLQLTPVAGSVDDPRQDESATSHRT